MVVENMIEKLQDIIVQLRFIEADGRKLDDGLAFYWVLVGARQSLEYAVKLISRYLKNTTSECSV